MVTAVRTAALAPPTRFPTAYWPRRISPAVIVASVDTYRPTTIALPTLTAPWFFTVVLTATEVPRAALVGPLTALMSTSGRVTWRGPAVQRLLLVSSLSLTAPPLSARAQT